MSDRHCVLHQDRLDAMHDALSAPSSAVEAVRQDFIEEEAIALIEIADTLWMMANRLAGTPFESAFRVEADRLYDVCDDEVLADMSGFNDLDPDDLDEMAWGRA